jgi:monofunctional biosynthetic peptidoglycan transglycosylase
VRLARRLAAGAAIAAVAGLAWLGFVWPPPSWWATHWPTTTAFMEMRAAQLRAAHDTTPRRYRPVGAEAMSPWLSRAAIAAEDQAFYTHHGIDYRSLRDALGYRRPTFAWRNPADRRELVRAVRHAWARRDHLRGASTITQQLARNLYLSPSRNPLRKLKEAAVAYRLEWALDKQRILELYLDVAEFGPNLWGVAAASERYFGMPPDRLSPEQAALLIATLPHPLTSTPAFRPARTRWRQQLILAKLRGEAVEIPPAELEDTAVPIPALIPDTGALAGDTGALGRLLDSIIRHYRGPPRSGAFTPDTPPLRDTGRARNDSAAAPNGSDTAAASRVPPGAGHVRQSIRRNGITRQR